MSENGKSGLIGNALRACCAAALLFAAVPAGAALVTTAPQQVSFYVSCFCNPEFDTEFDPVVSRSVDRSFTQFDPLLGILKEVKFTWISGVGATVYSVDVVDPQQTGNELTVDYTMNLLGLAPDPVLMSAQRKLVATLQANGSLGADLTDDPENGNRSYSSPADLSYFIGNASFTTRIGYRAEIQSDNATLQGFAAWYRDTDNAGQLLLEYTYETRQASIPETGTLLLTSLGSLVGLGVLRYRRRRTPAA